MKHIYFDGESGAAGDMILGALCDLGLDPAELSEVLKPIAPVEFSIELEPVSICGIGSQRVTVDVGDEPKHRSLSEIESFLQNGTLSEVVRERARRVFHRLAAAEAHVHNSIPEKVHFHEVGATDAIIDIVGSVWGLERLQISNVYATPLVLGSGLGRSAHGPIIYPAPAVMEILRGLPVRIVDGIGETTTPTGAAILAEVAEFSDHIEIVPERIGYGAGHRDVPNRPNLLRAIMGVVSDNFDTDRVWLGASDIDNTRPEVFDWLADRLREAGAIDVTFTDVTMKKGRRGQRVEVLCDSTTKARMAAIVLAETGSLGVRWIPVSRTKLKRRSETIDTPWGAIRIKVAETPDGERGIPEYDDCRRAAQDSGRPLLEIIDKVTRLFDEQHAGPATLGEGD